MAREVPSAFYVSSPDHWATLTASGQPVLYSLFYPGWSLDL